MEDALLVGAIVALFAAVPVALVVGLSSWQTLARIIRHWDTRAEPPVILEAKVAGLHVKLQEFKNLSGDVNVSLKEHKERMDALEEANLVTMLRVLKAEQQLPPAKDNDPK